jgi:hypothetical protein
MYRPSHRRPRDAVGVRPALGVGVVLALFLAFWPPAIAGAGTLTGLGWAISAPTTSFSGATYTYYMTAASSQNITATDITVPSGTTSSGALSASVSASSGGSSPYSISVTTGTPSLSGTTLSVPTSAYLPAGATVTMQVTGLINTSSAGYYTSTISTYNGSSLVDTGTASAVGIAGNALSGVYFNPSSEVAGASGVSYSYQFTTDGSGGSISAISFSVPPGTGFSPPSPSSITASPASIAGGTASLSGNLVTYSFSSVSLPANQVVSLSIPGFTNTSVRGEYPAGDIATANGSSPVDAAGSPTMAIATALLTSTAWSASSTTVNAASTYTYNFEVGTGGNLTAVTMSLPPGTTGTPSLGTLSAEAPGNAYAINPTWGTPTTANGVLSVPMAGSFPSGSTVSIQVTGLTNSPTAGSYPAALTTFNSATPVDSGITTGVPLSAGALSNLTLNLTSTAAGATGVSYTYKFTVPAGLGFDALTFDLPPGTGGTPALGTVTPPDFSGWSLSGISSTSITYQAASGSENFSSATAVSVQITGLTNTSTTGSYSETVSATENGSPAASGSTAPVAITSTALSNLSWGASPLTTSAANAVYTYGFTTASAGTLDQFTMTVPAGTSVTGGGSSVPIGTISAESSSSSNAYSISMANPSATLSGTTITFSFTAIGFPAGAVVSLQLTGLTNTSTAGNYSATITTYTGTLALDSGTTGAIYFTTTSLSSVSLTTSLTGVGATNVSYTYKFTVSAGTIDEISFTVPPGTGGSPGLGSVSPIGGSDWSDWSLSGISGDTITYSFNANGSYTSPPDFTSSTTLSVQLTGLTNTTTPGSYATTVTVLYGGSAVASGTTNAVSITSTGLTNVTWSPSSSLTSDGGVSYTYDFTTASSKTLDSIDMTVPTGTSVTGGGTTVTVQSASAQSTYTITIANPTATLSNGMIVFGFTAVSCPAGTSFTIVLTGLTNTPTAGNYQSTITTYDGSSAVDSGTTPPVNLTSTALTSLSWTASNSTISASSSYTFSFGVSASTPVGSVQMTVPAGTAGTSVAVGSVSPPALGGGQVSFDSSADVLTYTPPSTVTITSSETVSLSFTGLQNTGTPGLYTSNVTVFDSIGDALASGNSPELSITSNALSSLSWSANSNQTGQSGVDYTYQFTTASANALTSFQMSLPSGTSGLLSMGAASANQSGGGTISLPTITPSITGSVLVLSFSSTYVPSSTTISVQVDGFTNTSSPGQYSSSITTYDNTTALDSGTTPAVSFASSVLGSPSWSLSNSGTGQVSQYSYSFGFPDSTNLTTISMTVPAGTAASSPTVVSASPASVSGGSVSLSGNTLVYTLPGGNSGSLVGAGSTVSLVFGEITNTTTAGSYSSTITTAYDGTAVASGATSSVGITASVLSNVVWSPATETAAATGASYTYSFDTGSSATLTGVLVSVPPGTGGTLGVGTVSPSTLTGVTAAFVSGQNEIKFSFNSLSVNAGTAISLQVDGITNTATTGSYTASVSTLDSTQTIDSGTSGSVRFYASSVTLVAPSSLSWSASLGNVSQAVVDSSSADQSYTVTDDTGTNSGWNVTVSATTFTEGSHHLADTGTFSTNGSLTSSSSTTGPSATCISTCTSPTNAVSYPVQITTGSAPASYVVFSAAANTGSGSFEIGGSASGEIPVGWWVFAPANAFAGAYSSVVTFAIGSGP